jgi:hypothetical protein
MRADEPVHFLERLAGRVLRDEELRRQARQCAVGDDRKTFLCRELFGKCAEGLLKYFIRQRRIEPLARINDPCAQRTHLLVEVAG